jgi:TonB family protein
MEPKNLNNIILEQTLPQIQNQIKKPIKKEIVKDKPLLQKEELSDDQIKQLDNYKTQIRKSIQSVAIRNYPKQGIRRKLQGTVNIIFELNEDGSLINVRSGPNTKADKILINAAIKILKKSAPFDKIPFSKQKNEFSINIIYKLDNI